MPNSLLFALTATVMLCLTGCGGGGVKTDIAVPASMQLGPVATSNTTSSLQDRWYTQGAIMEINVRAYHDSNGDGVGDLNGVTEKLDYLKNLGVVGLWLMPINKTDDHDSGYILTDHRQIETEYGTMADLKRLIDEAHRRGMGVIMDYVMNHVADTNPLFVNSASSIESTYRDWFIWQPTPIAGWYNIAGNNPWWFKFPHYYYASFQASMPDFNLRNPGVLAYHKNNLRFWLNLGVDGFRFDAISTFIENGPGAMFDQPESLALMREMRQVVNEYANRYVVCEDPGQPALAASDNSCGSAFAFGLHSLVRSMARGQTGAAAQVASALNNLPMERMATLLANHDRFAGLRLMDEFDGDETSYRLAAATLLTLPGIPFIYYGEEVGMRSMPLSAFDASSDWPLRGPMSWDTRPSVTSNTRIGPYHYFQPTPNISTHNVVRASADTTSLWSYYKTLLNLRKDSAALREGPVQVLASSANSLAFERHAANESIIVVINTGHSAETLSLPSLTTGQSYAVWFNLHATATTLNIPSNGSPATVQAPARSVQIFRSAMATPK